MIEGHTDVIGRISRNKQLSLERAEAVEDLLRLTMANILDMSQQALKTWLSEHGVSLSSTGLGATKPLEVEIFRNGAKEKKLVGDDSLPEGRTINRSVIVIVRSESK